MTTRDLVRRGEVMSVQVFLMGGYLPQGDWDVYEVRWVLRRGDKIRAPFREQKKVREKLEERLNVWMRGMVRVNRGIDPYSSTLFADEVAWFLGHHDFELIPDQLWQAGNPVVAS